VIERRARGTGLGLKPETERQRLSFVNVVRGSLDLDSGGWLEWGKPGFWVLGPRDRAVHEGEGVWGQKLKTERWRLGFRERRAGGLVFG